MKSEIIFKALAGFFIGYALTTTLGPTVPTLLLCIVLGIVIGIL